MQEFNKEQHLEEVLHPSHYTQGGLEVSDIFKKKLTAEEFRGFCKGNVIKYILRGNYKGGIQDYRKASVYLQWLIESYEEEQQ